MAKAKPATKSRAPAPPTPFDLMAVRIQKIINSPDAQKAKSAVVEKAPHESQENWERFLGEVAENDNVSMDHRDDGSVRLAWTVPDED